jgi:hypothetical protein
MGVTDALTLGVICRSPTVSDFGGYRGCPKELELRPIAAGRRITFPRGETMAEGDPR